MGHQLTIEDMAGYVLNAAYIAIAVAVGFYLIAKIRDAFRQSEQTTSVLLDNFRDLHTSGQLSDEEYRNIKSKLAARLRDELKESAQAKKPDSSARESSAQRMQRSAVSSFPTNPENPEGEAT